MKRTKAELFLQIMSDEIVNKVAESGLIIINLEDFYPEGERVLFDMKDYLFEELLLKEKDPSDHLLNY